MKRILSALTLLVLFLLPGSGFAAEKLVVGVSPFPHKDIMLLIKAEMAAEGYDLEIREFSDYVMPNLALAEGKLFANYFQHVPYLENMNAQRNLGLGWLAKVHIEPMGLYSKKIKNIDQLKKGSRILLPNDPTNEARALRLLEKAGLISLKPGELITVRDISANPRGLKFVELDAPSLPRALPDADAAVINTNFAGQAGLTPARDALLVEQGDSPYANVIAIREADRNSPAAKALQRAANSPAVKNLINKTLLDKGILPAF